MSKLIYTGETHKPVEEVKAKLSYIEPHEVDEAKELVAKHLNELGIDKPPRPLGYYIVLKVWVSGKDISSFVDPISGDTKTFVLPESITAHQKYTSCTAMVVAIGPSAYSKDKFPEGPWVNVGDWVIIPRHECAQINYRGIPMLITTDNRMQVVIEDPSWVTRN